MIPRDYIIEWRGFAPWVDDAQVEQDLVLSRAIVELFREPSPAKGLAFRGGTALYKLHLHPAARYSEDIDLVQLTPEPIGQTLNAIRARLDPWLGQPRRRFNEGRVHLVYRFESEDDPPIPLRLKVEINSREHFTHLGQVQLPFRVDSRWFTGDAMVTSYRLDELAGTKLRALYQRKKGRDLFDLWLLLDRGLIDPETVVACFRRYMEHGETPVSRAEFEANLAAKADEASFNEDILRLLARGLTYPPEMAFERVGRELVARLPGHPWQGTVPGRP